MITTVCLCRAADAASIDLTLIPPGRVTDKITLDIRAGIVNHGDTPRSMNASVYLNV